MPFRNAAKIIRLSNFPREFRNSYFHVKFPNFKKHCVGQRKHICRLDSAVGPICNPWAGETESESWPLLAVIFWVRLSLRVPVPFSVRCWQWHLLYRLLWSSGSTKAPSTVLGTCKSLPLLLSTLHGTLVNSWLFWGSACECLTTTTRTQGPHLPCYSWWPESCPLWALSLLFTFSHLSDFRPSENAQALLIVHPFKCPASSRRPRGSS